jgi:HEAT repeat protein
MVMMNAQKKAIDAITIMNVAMTNIRLYPPSAAIIRNSVNRVYQVLTDILKHENSVVYAESGRNYIICGRFFSEQDQRRYPHARAFLELLSKFGIRSVSFEKRLTKPEVKTFLNIVSKNPEEIEKEKGLKGALEREKLPNIIIDHKVYVVVDRDQQIVAGLDIKDGEIIRFLTGDQALPAEDLQRIKELARDPGWINQVFQAGLAYVMRRKEWKSYEKLSEIVLHMIQTMEEISDEPDKEKVSRELARSIAGLEDDMLVLVLSQNIEGMFSNRLFDHVIDVLDDDKFERLAAKLKQIDGKAVVKRENPNAAAPKQKAADQAYSFMMRSGKGGRLADRIQRRMEEERRRMRQREAELKAALHSILQGEEAPFLKERVMEALPEYIDRLFKAGKGEVAVAILQKLSQKLCHDDPDIREPVSLSLSFIGRMLLSEGRDEVMVKILPDLLHWMKLETGSPTIAYKGIATQLQELAQKLIEDRSLLECNAILETFNRMQYGEKDRDEAIRRMAETALRDIATEGVLDMLLQELQSSVEERRKQAVRGLVQLGGIAIERLLDILQESRDMAERVRILNLVSEMGEAAVPMLVKKIRESGPWYYLRNLILMLGKVGAEKEVAVLQPYLKHEDFRVQREAVNSIYNIGGKFRGPTLLAVLGEAEERLRISIVDMLGALEYENAVDRLLEMFESKSFFSKKADEKLKEKICSALGRIGSEKAVPMLRAVAEQKSLLGIKSYPEPIREAASTALIRIHNAQLRKNELQDEGFKKTRIGTGGRSDLNLPGVSPNRGREGQTSPAQAPSTESKTGVQAIDFSLPSTPSDKTVKRNNDTIEDTAVSLLYKAIVAHARKKEFKEAEALRQQLIDTDAMALTEIIRAGEIIEAMKFDAGDIEPDHLEIWSDLYDSLTPEEADGLYYAMEEGIYEADEPVFQQGARNDRLIFIRQGQLRLGFSRGEREILIKTVGKGDIVGEDTFFSFSVCTTSLVALSLTKVNFIEKKVLEKWGRKFPALESKLHHYCLRQGKLHEILKNKGMDRRQQERVDLTGIASVHLLSPDGKMTGKRFRGGLLDISHGGLSFLIKAANPKNVSLLLGRKLGMQFEMAKPLLQALQLKWKVPPEKPRIQIRRIGTVIGVTHREEEDYSVHIRFEESLDLVVSKPASASAQTQAASAPVRTRRVVGK